MKKSNKPLTFTAAILAATIGVTNLSGCYKTDSDSEVPSTEIEATTEAFEPEENDIVVLYGPPPGKKDSPKLFKPKKNNNSLIYGPPPGSNNQTTQEEDTSNP